MLRFFPFPVRHPLHPLCIGPLPSCSLSNAPALQLDRVALLDVYGCELVVLVVEGVAQVLLRMRSGRSRRRHDGGEQEYRRHGEPAWKKERVDVLENHDLMTRFSKKSLISYNLSVTHDSWR